MLAPGRDELDVLDETMIDSYFARLPKLDVLVANAGILRDASLLKLAQADIEAGNRREPARRFPLRARGDQADGEAAQRAPHFDRLALGAQRPARPERLRGGEGGADGLRAKRGEGVRRTEHPLQRGAARFSPDEIRREGHAGAARGRARRNDARPL